MKQLRFILPLTVLIAVQACNNNGSIDSVEKADSLNAVKDTSSVKVVKGDVVAFLVNAINGNLLEIGLGKYAAKHATNKSVKQFAEMAVTVHKSFNAKIRDFAREKNISLPDSTSDKNMDKINDMMKKTGKDFDKAYMDKVVSDHKNDVDIFKKASDNLNDSSIKIFAANTISEIQKPLNEAEAIEKTVLKK